MAPRNTRVAPETEVRSPARSFLQSLDNFYAPQRDHRSEQATQEGIGAFTGIMQEQANRAKQLQREDERLQGIQDAMREQAGEEMRGVQTGSIFRQHSSFYMSGLNETRGRAAAARFKAETAQAYLDWEGRHTDDDGSAYRAWMNERVANFMGTLGDDQYRVAGALPIINEVANNFAAQHTGFTAERLETESFEAYDEIVSGIFLDLANGEVDMEEAVDRIASEADDMYLTDGAAANNRVVDAAIRYASIHNNPDSILALARAHDSGRLRISQSNREKLANAMDAVEADIAREASRSNAEQTAARKAADQAEMNAWAATLEANPYAEMPPVSEVPNAALRRDMMTLAAATRTAAEVTNPSIEAVDRINLEQELYNAGSVRDKVDILARFTLSNPTALSGADIARYTQGFMAQNDPGSIINDPMMGRYRTGFGQTLAEFQLGDGFDINRSSYLRTQGEMHYNDYLLSQTGTVDTTDRAAMRQLHTAATEYTMEQLAFDFPEVLREKQEQSPLGQNLGVGTALETRDAAVAAEAARIYEEAAGGGATQEGPETPGVDPEAPAEEAGTPEEQSFYGQLLKRFTDGQDDRASLQEVNAVLDNDPEFAEGINRLGEKYNVNPMALLAVMDFETGGTFDAGVKNAVGSGATGLIQFMPRTAEALGTTTEELAQMDRVEQLGFVEKYLDQWAGRIEGGSVDDLYMSVLWPAAIGKPDGYVIFRSGTTAYDQNRGLDTNGDGTITKFEAANKVRNAFYGY